MRCQMRNYNVEIERFTVKEMQFRWPKVGTGRTRWGGIMDIEENRNEVLEEPETGDTAISIPWGYRNTTGRKCKVQR